MYEVICYSMLQNLDSRFLRGEVQSLTRQDIGEKTTAWWIYMAETN